MKFIRDFSFSSITMVIITIIVLLNNIIITRHLGPEGRGKYSVILNLIILLSLFFGEGTRKINLLMVSKNKNSVKKLLNQANIFNLLISLLLISLYYSLQDIWNQLLPNISSQLLIFSIIIVSFTIFSQSIQAFFLGLNKIYNYNLMQILSVILTFFVNLFGIYFLNFTLLDIILSILLGLLISSVIGYLILLKDTNKSKVESASLEKKSLSIGIKSTIAGIFLFIIFRGDIFLVNYFLGASAAGLYSVALLFSELMQKIPNVSGPLLIAKTVGTADVIATENTTKLVRTLFFINLVAVLFLAASGYFIIIILFGKAFGYSYNLLLLLLPAILVFGPTSMIYSYFISKSYPIKSIIINLVAALFNIILNIIFIPIYGLISVPIISSFTYILWLILYSNYFSKNSDITYKDIFILQKRDFIYIISSLKRLIGRFE